MFAVGEVLSFQSLWVHDGHIQAVRRFLCVELQWDTLLCASVQSLKPGFGINTSQAWHMALAPYFIFKMKMI